MRSEQSRARFSRFVRLIALAALCAAVCASLASCALVDAIRGTEGERGVEAPEHPVSVQNVSAGTLLDYFADVAFGSEYGESEEIVCKWKSRVKFCILGDATDEDRELIARLCSRLNEIDGFPGIEEVSRETGANMTVSFVSREEIMKQFENADANCAGMAQYTWDGKTGSGEIRSARCAIDSALGADRANTVCEEFLQALGPARDSYMFSESAFYQGYTLMPFPAEVDFAVMEILYSPRIPAGTPKLEAMSLAAQIVAWE